MLIFDLLIYGLLLLLLLWNGKPGKYADDKKQVLENLNALRGIFAVEIIIGHGIRYEQSVLYPLGKFMICSVAFFFFISAMGLTISFQEKKEKYLTYRFWLTKPCYLLLLAVLIYLINYAVDLISGRNAGYYCRPVFSNFFTATNWYLWMQIIFYVVFYLVYKYIKKYRVLLVAVFALVSGVVFYKLGFVEGWWASGFAFPLGLMFGEHYEKLKKKLYSAEGVIGIAALALFGSLCLIIPAENVITTVFMRNAVCIAAIVVFWLVCSRFRLGNNSVSRGLGRISTELYISQFIWLRLSETYESGYQYGLLFVCAATFLTAVCIHPVVLGLKKIRLKVSDRGTVTTRNNQCKKGLLPDK